MTRVDVIGKPGLRSVSSLNVSDVSQNCSDDLHTGILTSVIYHSFVLYLENVTNSD